MRDVVELIKKLQVELDDKNRILREIRTLLHGIGYKKRGPSLGTKKKKALEIQNPIN